MWQFANNHPWIAAGLWVFTLFVFDNFATNWLNQKLWRK